MKSSLSVTLLLTLFCSARADDSPDGRWIVHGSKHSGVRNLFVMRLSDRKEHALTDVPAGHAAMHAYWQPRHR